MEWISYYELLEMIKDHEEPKEITLYLNCGSRKYCASYDRDTFSHYELKKGEREDENFNYYLAGTLLESQMHECLIEINVEAEEITLYELLGLIKDDKAPEVIDYDNEIWHYSAILKDYSSETIYEEDCSRYLLAYYDIGYLLNDKMIIRRH